MTSSAISYKYAISKTTLSYVVTDIFTLYATSVAALVIRLLSSNALELSYYIKIAPVLLLMPLFGFALGAYQTILPPPPQEFRQLSLSTSLTFLVIGVVIFMAKENVYYSRLAFAGAWLACMVTLPLARSWLRGLFASAAWWGLPAIIIGEGGGARAVYDMLKARPEMGLRPMARVSLEEASQALLDGLCEPMSCAILVLGSHANEDIASIIGRAIRQFRKVFLMPQLTIGGIHVWLSAEYIGDMPSLLVRQNLLDPVRLRIKRIADLIMTIAGSVVLLPLGVLIALFIFIESPGPVFFRQQRQGHGGRPIQVLKFRTMVRNAEHVLAQTLESDPALREEWACCQKLRKDPRTTRVGAFLRRYSLDELPQLWNVIKGDMSLVGPRPIIKEEIARYEEKYADYIRVKPGLTGLWQVSGRNRLQYEERIRLDSYYICNWSIWFDIWILARTFPAVISGDGAC